MKFNSLISILFFSLLTQFLFSQALTGERRVYTRADTLRGSLRPERTCYDVTFYELNVIIDTLHRSISGSSKIVFKTLHDFETLQIDLYNNMNISTITAQGKELKYHREFNAVFVDMPQTMKAGTDGEITVNYYGKPVIAKNPPWDGGFTWTYDSTGKFWLGVSCEGMGASLWWPCKDYLGDEPDSMRIICTVPNGLKCICNGNEDREVDNPDYTTTFYWKISYPINNYNVTLNIADYAHFSDEYVANDGSKLALDYYVLPYNLERAQLQFRQVKPMLKCYEKYVGKYPFWNDGYALVETPYLGMEHQSAISYGNRYLTGYAGRDYSHLGLNFDYIIIHESAHEWWGNSVSCRDLADMWIHESFATYTESMYVDCLHGNDTAILYINAKKYSVGNKIPIVGDYNVNNEGSGDMYEKGSLFLNTLRHVVNNDKLWWSLIKGMSDTAFRFKNIGYLDVVDYFNRKTGMDLGPLFDQYLKNAKIPVFEYKLQRTGKKEYDLSYHWITDVKDFKMPVLISYSGKKDKRIQCTNDVQHLAIQLKNESDFKINEDLMYFDNKKL